MLWAPGDADARIVGTLPLGRSLLARVQGVLPPAQHRLAPAVVRRGVHPRIRQAARTLPTRRPARIAIAETGCSTS